MPLCAHLGQQSKQAVDHYSYLPLKFSYSKRGNRPLSYGCHLPCQVPCIHNDNDSPNSQFIKKVPDYFSFQPRFGYIDLNGSKTGWMHHDSGLQKNFLSQDKKQLIWSVCPHTDVHVRMSVVHHLLQLTGARRSTEPECKFLIVATYEALHT